MHTESVNKHYSTTTSGIIAPLAQLEMVDIE